MEYIPYKNLAPTTSFEHLVELRGTFGSRSIVEVPWCSPTPHLGQRYVAVSHRRCQA
jgi:hypothetical protein